VTLEDLVARHRRVALDANALVYLLEAPDPLGRVTAAILDAAESGRLTVVLATLALAEIAVGPVRAGDETIVERYADEIRDLRGVQIVPLTADIALDVGVIRGRHRIRLADAIHLATARRAGASAIVTNDRQMPDIPQVAVIQLADLVA
jgi:predicted nucleic acid-binding protein